MRRTLAFMVLILSAGTIEACSQEETKKGSAPAPGQPGANDTPSGVEKGNPAQAPADTAKPPGAPGGGGCDVPAEAQAVDTSKPTTVIGQGTAASCTAEALDAAVQKGGIVTFACGSDPVTITLTTSVRINNVAKTDGFSEGDTVIDGGGNVTLRGQNRTRIFYLNACEEPYNSDHCQDYEHPSLTVQNLTLADGNVVGDDQKNDLKAGGGAIFVNGGRLKVVNSKFFNNHCNPVAQDVGGGAIATYLQTKPVYIVNSTFGGEGIQGNSCSNGGALASIGTSYTILNSLFTNNQATGRDGNPGNGGNGGAIVTDGNTFALTLCGTTLLNNRANAFGGGIFFVSNDNSGTTRLERSALRGNTSGKSDGSKANDQGLYLQGTQTSATDTPVE